MCEENKHDWEQISEVPNGPCRYIRTFRCRSCGNTESKKIISHKGHYQRLVTTSGSSDWGLTSTYICDNCGRSHSHTA